MPLQRQGQRDEGMGSVMGGRETAGRVRAPHAARYLIGLTGNIACGKSTVLAHGDRSGPTR